MLPTIIGLGGDYQIHFSLLLVSKSQGDRKGFKAPCTFEELNMNGETIN